MSPKIQRLTCQILLSIKACKLGLVFTTDYLPLPPCKNKDGYIVCCWRDHIYICQSRRWHCGDRHFAQQLNVHWPCLPIASAQLNPYKVLIVQPVVTRFCNLAF